MLLIRIVWPMLVNTDSMAYVSKYGEYGLCY